MGFDVWSISIILIKFLTYMFSLFSVGTFLFAVILKPKEQLSPRHWSTKACLSAIALSLLLIPFNVGLFSDDGIRGMFDYQIFVIVMDSPIGVSMHYRILGLALLLISFRFSHLSHAIIGSLGALAISWSFTQIGHLSNAQPSLIRLLLILHLLGIGFWIGAFAPLYRAAGGHSSNEATANLARQFGQLAVYIVFGLFIAGTVMAFFLLGSPEQIYSSEYGRMLALKILIFCALLAVAAFNKLRLVPGLRDSEPKTSIHLQWSITLEAALVCAILVITAILTTVTELPAHH